MKTNKEQLLKHFATVLRNLALGKETDTLMSKNLVFYFTRKELIDMVTKFFNGTIPKEHNLVELENKELLELIDNDLFIISFVTAKWFEEEMMAKALKQSVENPDNKKSNAKKSPASTGSNHGKKDKTSA